MYYKARLFVYGFLLNMILLLGACKTGVSSDATPKEGVPASYSAIDDESEDEVSNVRNEESLEIAPAIPVGEFEIAPAIPVREFDFAPNFGPRPSSVHASPGEIASAALIAGSGSSSQGPAQVCFEYIINGGFETGDFTGFHITNSGSGSWFISTGDPTPLSGLNDNLPPITGRFDVVTDQLAPGEHLLTQPVTLPPNITKAIFSFKDRIRNAAGVFSHFNQEYRVLIENPALMPIKELFTTGPGDNPEQFGPNPRSFDLEEFFEKMTGQSIIFSFQEQDNLGNLNINLDDVSLVMCTSCGNSVLQLGEQCDDGNNVNGDGCSQACTIERMFGSDDLGNIFLFDPKTPSVKQLGNTGTQFGSTEIECDPFGNCYSQGRDGTFIIEKVDLINPAVIGPPINDGLNFNGLQFVGQLLYGTGVPSPCTSAMLAVIDQNNGAKDIVGLLNTGRPMSGLAYDIRTQTMYGVDGCGADGPSNLYTIDLFLAQATLIGNTGKRLGSLEFGPDGKLYAGSDSSDGGKIYRIDPLTAEATFVIQSGLQSVTGLAFGGP